MKLTHTALFACGAALVAAISLACCGPSGEPEPPVAGLGTDPGPGPAPNTATDTGPGPAAPVQDPTPPKPVPFQLYGYKLVASYPHDPEAFTQGLVFDGGRLFESTGQRGHSTLREVDLFEGSVLRNWPLENDLHFAEGLEVVGDKLFQLTWQARVGFIYDKHTFEQLGTFTYQGEGWGLTWDGTHLVLSDGTPTLRFLNVETFQEERRVTVTGAGNEVRNINELEFVNGEIWANVWKLNDILRIDPETGNVVGVIDLSGLNTYPRQSDFDGSHRNVLNGIAYDEISDRIFVTGKQWPELHEIEIVKK